MYHFLEFALAFRPKSKSTKDVSITCFENKGKRKKVTSTLKTTSNICTCANCTCIHFPTIFYHIHKNKLKQIIHNNSVALLQRDTTSKVNAQKRGKTYPGLIKKSLHCIFHFYLFG